MLLYKKLLLMTFGTTLVISTSFTYSHPLFVHKILFSNRMSVSQFFSKKFYYSHLLTSSLILIFKTEGLRK